MDSTESFKVVLVVIAIGLFIFVMARLAITVLNY